MTEDLLPTGRRRVAFGAASMPVLRGLAQEWASTRPLEGVRIAASLHVTVETAQLCATLVAGGAEVVLAASHPFSTQPDVAAVLAEDVGLRVLAGARDDAGFAAQLDEAAASRPRIVIDDGAELTVRLHAAGASGVDAATEITSSGVARVEALSGLTFPVYSVDGSGTKQAFDNPIGTAQASIDGLLRATNMLLAGASAVVVGYGPVGSGLAAKLRGLGARVTVTEVDPRRALAALLAGHDVRPLAQALPTADVVITATGRPRAVVGEHFALMKDGVVIGNVGHFTDEIALGELAALAVGQEVTRPLLTAYEREDGARLTVVAGGALLGPAAAEANSPQVMDLTFAAQALLVEHLVASRPGAPGVLPVPAEIDVAVAARALAARAVAIDVR